MPNAARLSGVGTFYAFEFDDNTNSSFSVSIASTAFSNEFDENTSTTLSGSQRMSATSSGGVIVLDSINEIDPFGEISTDGLQLHLDSVDSNITEEGTAQGQQIFTTSGTFTVPAGVTQVSAVVVGGGGGGGDSTAGDEPGAGGGGGGLAYGTFTVTPGESLTVTVGTGGAGGEGNNGNATTIARGATTLLSGGGGGGGSSTDGDDSGGGAGGSSGGTERDGGGTGGQGGSTTDSTTGCGGGGGAAGYSDNGGAGADIGTTNATAGAGGGGGGGGSGNGTSSGGGGGGVGLRGEGNDGAAGSGTTGGGAGSDSSSVTDSVSTDGSSGTTAIGGAGGTYGGGGSGGRGGDGGGDGSDGAARIIWGTGRSYPSTLTTDQSESSVIYIWEDLSGNNRDATFIGVVADPTSGNFINFDGTDDHAATDGAGTGASSYLGIDGTGARTSIVFFKLDSNTITAQNRLLAWGLPGTTGGKWAMELSTANEINIGVAGGSRRTVTTYDFSKWTMIAATYPGGVGDTTDIRIWVNGIEQTDLGGTTQTVDTDTTTESTGYVSVGAAVLQGVAPINTPNGFVDGLFAKAMIYNRELSDLEIKVVYRSILRRLV